MDFELDTFINRYQEAMNTVYRHINIMMKEKTHEAITTDQFSTLLYIEKHMQCTATEIAHVFGIGKSAVTAQVNRLYDKKLVDRRRDEKDRRHVYLTITDHGSALVDYTKKEIQSVVGTYLSHFDVQEINTFIQSLEKLACIMETDNQSAERNGD